MDDVLSIGLLQFYGRKGIGYYLKHQKIDLWQLMYYLVCNGVMKAKEKL